jgi:hypothetical protein
MCPKFGRSEDLRGNLIGRDENSEDERKGSNDRKLIGRTGFSEAFDRSKGGASSNESMKLMGTSQEEDDSSSPVSAEPPLATAIGPTISWR